ncbi:nonribosomal siderophore peptide synthase [Fusarium beomiforme]|uniref:Nonribosomal siderophore peptide synthase n=1 Tax=Fusarium beomiforme TaxID=44412 RepID=A0A9P5A708_9HYPO|nr:nonribosomal siderophore peptide synthase [Fusarium beomiforme]
MTTPIIDDGQAAGTPPATKVPSLDTIDHYLPSSAKLLKNVTKTIFIPYPPDVFNVERLIQVYARFVSGLTGVDEVAFILVRDLDPGSSFASLSVVLAVIDQNAQHEDMSFVVTWELLDISCYQKGQIQFALDLRESHFDDDSVLGKQDFFVLHIRLDAATKEVAINISYPSLHIPELAAAQLLKILTSQVIPDIETLGNFTPEFSIVNHPPLLEPPSKFTSGWHHAPAATHLHCGFEYWASKNPNDPALDFILCLPDAEEPAQHEVFSYGMLNHAANSLASHLLNLVSRDTIAAGQCIIPVYMSTSSELYISYLAILKAGLTFCPLPMEAPMERIRELIQDLLPPVVLGIGEKPDAWADQGIQTKWSDVTQILRRKDLVTECNFQLPPAANNQLAYVLFTSGSTGKPKGVQVSHSAAVCSIGSHSTVISLPDRGRDGFRWFQFAAPTFDPSIMEIFVTLSNGGTLCAAPRTLTLTNLEGTINEARATIMMATPSLAALIRPSRLQTLKFLWCMGEKLNRTVINNFGLRSPDTSYTLANFYGPTEAAINCTFLAPVNYWDRGSIIGEALPTCSMFILDQNSQVTKVTPAGFVGELAIGGPQVGNGYLHLPEETAKAYVQTKEYGRLYRTGDLARIVWDKSGRRLIEFLGRISSDQVKLSGRRVELGEIESVLASVPGVTELVTAVSKASGDREGSERIIACIVANTQSSDERQAIVDRCFCNSDKFLPDYMRPSTYIFLETLPRSSSGKVDRKKVHSEVLSSNRYQAFTSSIESQALSAIQNGLESPAEALHSPIYSVFMSALSETVGEASSSMNLDTTLASLGLDSLGAVRLLQNLRDNSIKGLEVEDVLQSGTIKTLAVKVALASHSQGSNSKSIARRDQVQKALHSFAERNLPVCIERLGLHKDRLQALLPTTATQSGMLASFLRGFNSTVSHVSPYIYHSVMPVREGVDIENLKRAWDTVTSRYDSFRTVFCHVDDDMSPFAQCMLKPSNDFVKPIWNIFRPGLGHGTHDDAIELACRNAEAKINISVNPWHISLVSSAGQSTVILSMFHGIFDGGSLQILLQDVIDSYNDRPALERTSLEHIVHHHFSAESDATARFWNNYLKGYSPVEFPSLTSYRPSPSPKSYMVEVDSCIGHSELRKASKSMGVTPLSVLQAAWASILLAYSGTSGQDIVFGGVVSGRLDPRTENCVGPTFTTIPVRLSVESNQTNRLTAQSLMSSNAASLRHLQPRLGSIVTPDGRLPYDTLLAYQDFNARPASGELWTCVRHLPMANDFAVMVEVWPESDSRLTLRATFNDDYMDCGAAELMLHELSLIVSRILKQPNEIFSANIFFNDESLGSYLDPAASYEVASNALIHCQFESHARSNPDDHALIFRGHDLHRDSPDNMCWTYVELNFKAQSLADYMLSIFGPLTGSIVPIHIEKSPALYVAILGILKAGGAWCPIDVYSPSQRRQDLIVRTEAQLVLVSSADSISLESALPRGVLPIDVSPFTRDSERNINLKARDLPITDPTKMAYMIWTSGTTGAPKGVPITHSSACTGINSLIAAIPGTRDGKPIRCLQFSQPTFDVSIQDMFFTWSSGGVLISAPRDVMLGSFAELANLTGATHAHLTPTFSAGIQRSSCKTLQTITMIGEKLPQSVADDWGQKIRAFNTYGPAEATIVSTIREFGNEHNNVKSANIGWPLRSVSVFVTRKKKLVMKNAVGELALAGPQLSPGYLKLPETNKAKYVWNEEAGQVLYHTGDLVRMLSDGSLEYLSRTDDLVKLGGIRVELSEISFALSQCHPLVESIETMLLNHPGRPNDAVVAFIAAPQALESGKEGQTIILNDVAIGIARSAIKEASTTLPDHMIPSHIVILSCIPKTQSAKADRRALQALYAGLDVGSWETACHALNENIDSPTDNIDHGLKHTVTQAISLLSHVSAASITESSRLRSLGIDSIRAIRLTSRLNEAGYRLSVIDVLQCEAVRDLILLVGSSCSNGSQSRDLLNLEQFNLEWHGGVSALIPGNFFVCPAKTIQESFLSETLAASEMYWSHHTFTIHPDVNIGRLNQAWMTVCKSNDALRTGFLPAAAVQKKPSGHGNFVDILQILYEQHDIDWKHIECTDESYQRFLHQRIIALREGHQASYFRHPPWALTIMENGGVKTMIFSIHHVLHDGQSLGYITDDVSSAYSAEAPRRPQLRNVLPVMLPSHKSFDDTEKFWERQLAEYAELEVPSWPDLTGERTTPEKEKGSKFITEIVQLSFPAAHLEAKAAELGVSSVASIARAAFGLVLSSYLGSNRVVFAETLSDRVLGAEVDRSIGPFISVVPVPFHSKGTVREVLAEQNRLSKQAHKYRHIHARSIRKLLNKERGESLYPAVFTFHPNNELDLMAASAGTLWEPKPDEFGLTVEHPMALNMFQDSNSTFILEVSSLNSIMSPEQLLIFARQIDALVGAMLCNPDVLLPSLPGLINKDLLSISAPSPSDAVKESANLSPVRWIEIIAEQHPEWTAVEEALSITEAGAKRLFMSYRELNAVANRVAAYLSRCGTNNRTVALCSRRNLISYAVLVGIMKSGNAYLPVDEGLPDDRKVFLIEDGNAPLVFTETAFASAFGNAPSQCRIICLDEPTFQRELLALPSENRAYAADPHDTAYILYTSGSTGKPKGVMITRANLSSFIESLSEFICCIAPATLELGGKGRWLGQASRAFDPHIAEMFFPWRHGMATSTGARLLLMDDLKLTLSKLEITHAGFVPSLLDQANILPQDCPSLRLLSVGGEKMSQRVLDTWGRQSRVAIMNAYGPTELTIGCSFAPVHAYSTMRNIGHPLASCACHVLLPNSLDYALVGQTGELCFTGDLVGKGYLNRPDAKGFAIGPGGAKIYRTGDVGRIMADGSIEYLGRGDDQTKIRGQRLELGEISELLRTSSRVSIDVVTIIAKHPGLARNQLVSFISRLGAQPNITKGPLSIISSDIGTLGKHLQEMCRRKLPSYMVPEIVLPVNRIPYAAMSDKVNIKLLQELFTSLTLPEILRGNEVSNGRLQLGRELTENEEVVVDAICKTIAIDRSIIFPHTNIFEIGIDSLSAINLSIHLRNAALTASVALIMSNPVVEQLASLLWGSNPASKADSPSEVQKRLDKLVSDLFANRPSSLDESSVSSVRPCLPLQEGLVARSINSSSGLYVNHIVLKINPSVDSARLHTAWRHTIQDTEILRTVFVPLPSEIAQVVLEPNYGHGWTEELYDDLEVAMTDFQSRHTEIARDIISNIMSIPPLRVTHAVSAVSKQPLALFISVHHCLYDGASLDMLLQDFAMRYLENAELVERGSPESFIKHVCSQSLEKSETYWRRILSGCRPTIFNEPASDPNHHFHSTTLSPSLPELESCAARLRSTISSLVQAVFALALADAVGTCDVTYGLVLSGRTYPMPGADSVLLPCIATIPARLDTRDLSSVDDVIQYVHKDTAEALDYQHVSLRHIQRWIQAEGPIFDCLFSFTKSAQDKSHDLWEVMESSMPSEYPLALEVEADEKNKCVRATCGFTSAFGKPDDARDFMAKINLIITAMASKHSISLDSFNLSRSGATAPLSGTKDWDEYPWSNLETGIYKAVKRFCGLEDLQISRNASFLRLGLDSVTSIAFSSQLREAGIPVSSAEVIRYPCIGALARSVVDKAAADAPSSPQSNCDDNVQLAEFVSRVEVLRPDDAIESVFKCSPLQTAMITQTLGTNGVAYVHPHAVKLAESTCVDRLKEAYRLIIMAHDILRTSFHFVPEMGFSWVGAVHSNTSDTWQEVTVPSGSDMAQAVMPYLRLDTESAFSVPPIRPLILNDGKDRLLIIMMHHSLYDGVSLPFLFNDLASAYRGALLQSRPRFADAARSLSQDQTDGVQFWTKSFEGYAVTPLTQPAHHEPSSKMFYSEVKINLAMMDISESCKRMEVTVQTVAIVAYAKLLAKMTGKRDVAFGQVLAGRSSFGFEAERVVGPLFNTVPRRVTLDPTFISNRNMAQMIQRFTSEAHPYDHAPLHEVQKSLRRNGVLTRATLVDTLFVFQKTVQTLQESLKESEIWSPYITNNYIAESEYKMNLEVEQTDKAIIVRASCQGDVMAQRDLDQALKDFSQAFCDVVEHPSRCVTIFPECLQALPLSLGSLNADTALIADTLAPTHETAIQTILSQVSMVPVEAIRPNTSIFSIGLDSISAIRVASLCRTAGLKATVSDVLEGNTLRGISLRVHAMSQQDTDKCSVTYDYSSIKQDVIAELGLKPEAIDKILPCLSGQMYHLTSWLQTGRRLFEPAWPFFCSERIDIEKMKDAWLSLRQNNSILRTCFYAISPSEIVQVVVNGCDRNDGSFQLASSPETLDILAINQAREAALKPSSLRTPPVRLVLLKAVDRDGILILMNHAIYDAWTMPLFINELTGYYQGEEPTHRPDFASFIGFSVQSLKDVDEHSYWQKAIGHSAPTIIKSSRSGQVDNDITQKSEQIFVGASEIVKGFGHLDRVCRSSDVSLQSVVILAVSRILARDTGTSSPTLGLYQTGRSSSFQDIDRLTGPCLNVTPLTVDGALPEGEAGPLRVREIIRSVQTALTERIPFEQSSLRDILSYWREGVNDTSSHLFNVWLNLLWMQRQSETTIDNPAATRQMSLLEHLPIGAPTSFIPSQPFPCEDGSATSVCKLDISYLPEENIYIDVAPDIQTDTIGFGVRVQGGVIDKEEARMLVERIGKEITAVVRELGVI